MLRSDPSQRANSTLTFTGLYAAARTLQQAYRHLLEHGGSRGFEDRMLSFEEFGEVVGLESKYALDERFAADEPE